MFDALNTLARNEEDHTAFCEDCLFAIATCGDKCHRCADVALIEFWRKAAKGMSLSQRIATELCADELEARLLHV